MGRPSFMVGVLAVAAVMAVAAYASSTATTAATATLDLLDRPGPATTRGAHKLLLEVAAGGPGLVAVGESGLLLGSADGGTSWTQLPSPTSVMLTSLSFPDAKHGWVAGHDGVVLATSNGGLSWQRQFDGERANNAMLASARDALAAAQAAKSAKLLEAEDTLATAEDAVKAGPSRPLLSVHFADTRRGWVAGAFGQLFATDNGGTTWRYIGDRLPNPEGLHLNRLSAGGDGALYVAAELGAVFISTDGGSSWRRSETGYNGHLYGVIAAESGALIAYGFNGRLFRSTNAGNSWQPLTSPSPKTWVQAVPHANAVLLLSEDGRLFITRDAGNSFQPMGNTLAERRFAGFTVAAGRVVAVGQGGVGLHPISLDSKTPKP